MLLFYSFVGLCEPRFVTLKLRLDFAELCVVFRKLGEVVGANVIFGPCAAFELVFCLSGKPVLWNLGWLLLWFCHALGRGEL